MSFLGCTVSRLTTEPLPQWTFEPQNRGDDGGEVLACNPCARAIAGSLGIWPYDFPGGKERGGGVGVDVDPLDRRRIPLISGVGDF